MSAFTFNTDGKRMVTIPAEDLAQLRADMKEQQETLDYLTEHIIPKYKADNARLQKAVDEAGEIIADFSNICGTTPEITEWLESNMKEGE
jgi:hypothetical protein